METLNVFNIQRYSLHDGEGIRTLIFLKGCPLRCPWCANPESQRVENEIMYDAKACIGCQRCREVCPANYETFAGRICPDCEKCVEECYTGALQKVSKVYAIDELVWHAQQDWEFYWQSGGGVTLSGGEPFYQGETVLRLIEELKNRGLHVNAETCGYVDYDLLRQGAEMLDQILYDVKCVDEEKHKQVIGVSNEKILENLRRLPCPEKVIIRVPLIEGFNAQEEEIRAIGELAKERRIRQVHLLPYHRLGEHKYAKLNRPYRFKGSAPKNAQALCDILSDMGLSSSLFG